LLHFAIALYTIKNINIDTLNKLNKDSIINLIMFKWYMYTIYDVVDCLGEKYVIVGKTKKKIELVRYNINKETRQMQNVE